MARKVKSFRIDEEKISVIDYIVHLRQSGRPDYSRNDLIVQALEGEIKDAALQAGVEKFYEQYRAWRHDNGR